MNDSDGEKVCAICGYDSSTRNPSNSLPTKLWLNDRYLVGKATAYENDCIAYIGWDNAEDSIITVYEYFPSFAIRNPDKTVSVSDQDKYSFNGGLLRFIEVNKTLSGAELASLIPAKDIFEENGTAYVIKPQFTGIVLSDFLSRNGGSLRWEQARPLFLPVMDTLKAMHEMGIIHGNISPETVLVGRDGKLRLGSVSLSVEDKADINRLNVGFSAVEQYMPEQYGISAATDVYSLSATLFNVLIGNIPPAADLRLQNDSLSVPSKFAEVLPRNVLVALANGLQVLPEKRTADIEGFRNELVYGNAADGSDINTTVKKQSSDTEASKVVKRKGGSVKSAVLAAVCTCAVFLIVAALLCFTVFKDFIFPKEPTKKPNSSEVSAPSSQVIGSMDEGAEIAPKQYSVPSFIGKWYSSIVDDKDKQYENFVITIKDKVFSDKYAKGTVVEQSVKAGTSVLKNTEIQLIISLGPKEVKIANVIGRDELQAKMDLLKQGFIYENIVVEEYSDSEALYGTVVKQEPAYGTKTNTDITVTIYVNIENNKEDEEENSSVR